MFCRQCGAEIDENDAFCSNCGYKREQTEAGLMPLMEEA